VTGPDPAVAATRLAVRRALQELVPLGRAGGGVLVACSGGADSLALLAATVFEARREARRVIGVTVDHALQEGSGEHADRVVTQMAALGVTETMAVRVRVEAPGMGPEAAARQARYAALSQAAEASRVATVLLGHTRDDQAETVLLGLTRGSGGRSIAGMRRWYDEGAVRFVRPLLDLSRAQTERACGAEGLEVWHDPHNEDPRFTRSRLRKRVMPVLEEELGPGVAGALARTGELLQQDLAALEQLSADVYTRVRTADGALCADRLAVEHPALASRVLRATALAAGSSPAELSKAHVDALVGLVQRRHGEVQLPGHLTAFRDGDRLRFRRTSGGVAG
jgi:tRNA(Ile)-lysidine synthase